MKWIFWIAAFSLGVLLRSGDKALPPVETHHPFVALVYGRDMAPHLRQSLSSLYAQDYPHLRVIFFDDASEDETAALAEQLIVELGQEERSIVLRSDHPIGFAKAIEQVASTLEEGEIFLPLQAADRLLQSDLLSRWNAFFQIGRIYRVEGPIFSYPTYEKSGKKLAAFYPGRNLTWFEANYRTLFDERPSLLSREISSPSE